MSDQPATRLVLIRHGESVSTVERRIGGHRTCGGLSAEGVRQSERLRDRLAATGELTPTVVYSSAYPRARQTADIVAPAFGDVPRREHAGFGEHDPGEQCDGMSFDDFVAVHGQVDWENQYAETFPGGETLAAFHFRVGTAVHDVLEADRGGTIVVFCHGGVVDATFRNLLRIAPTGSFQLHTINTAITAFDQVRPGQWRLLRYNDAAHLAG